MRIKVILKPCPFCGNPAELKLCGENEKPEWVKDQDFWKIGCTNPYCMIRPNRWGVSKTSLVDGWNERKRANPYTYRESNNQIEIDRR